MTTIAFEIAEEVLASFGLDAASFTHELRIAAAVKWYELQQLSQSRAAEVADLSRAEFIDALNRFGVSPFQVPAEELIADAGGE